MVSLPTHAHFHEDFVALPLAGNTCFVCKMIEVLVKMTSLLLALREQRDSTLSALLRANRDDDYYAQHILQLGCFFD